MLTKTKIEKMETTKVIKDPCEQYYIDSKQHSWTTFTISHKGDLFINGDWGYYAVNWRAFGESFKKFLIDINEEYFITNIERQVLTFSRKKMGSRQVEALSFLFMEFQKALAEEIKIAQHEENQNKLGQEIKN